MCFEPHSICPCKRNKMSGGLAFSRRDHLPSPTKQVVPVSESGWRERCNGLPQPPARTCTQPLPAAWLCFLDWFLM